MKKAITILLFCLFGQIASGAVYELRTYVTNPGKLDNLNARFRDHTVGLFKKHGIESVGYWVPTDGESSKNTLISSSGTTAGMRPRNHGRPLVRTPPGKR